MLEARWLIYRIWCHGSLHGDQGNNDYTEMLRREVELVSLRLSALVLFKEKCFTPYRLWDFMVIYETAQRRIEKEHDLILESESAQSMDLEMIPAKKKTALTRTAWVSETQYLCPWVLVVLDVSEDVRGAIPL